MNDDIIGKCWHCGAGLTKADYGRETSCLACNKPTRVCRNCRHFAPGRLFDPSPNPAAGPGPAPEDALRQAAEDLFR